MRRVLNVGNYFNTNENSICVKITFRGILMYILYIRMKCKIHSESLNN